MYEYIGITLTSYEEKLVILKFLGNQLTVYTTALISHHNPTTFLIVFTSLTVCNVLTADVTGALEDVMVGVMISLMASVMAAVLAGVMAVVLAGVMAGIMAGMMAGVMAGVMAGMMAGMMADVMAGMMAGVMAGVGVMARIDGVVADGWLVAVVRLLSSSKGTGDTDALYCSDEDSAAAIPEVKTNFNCSLISLILFIIWSNRWF